MKPGNQSYKRDKVLIPAEFWILGDKRGHLIHDLQLSGGSFYYNFREKQEVLKTVDSGEDYRRN